MFAVTFRDSKGRYNFNSLIDTFDEAKAYAKERIETYEKQYFVFELKGSWAFSDTREIEWDDNAKS